MKLWRKRLRLAVLAASLSALAAAQAGKSVPAWESGHSAPAPRQRAAPSRPVAPRAEAGQEHRVSPEEARELFRSVDEILQFASEKTGLPIRHKVKKKLATREEVARYVADRMKEEGSKEHFDREARPLIKLGLLPRGFHLRQYMLGLYKEQVEGWYDAHSKTVYLLDWVDPEDQKPVMAHELVHALQDQNFGLEKFLNVAKDSKDDSKQLALEEKRTARQAVVEGQAMVVLYDYQMRNTGQTVESAPGIVDSLRQALARGDSGPMYADAPICLREALLFPYTYGMDFERAILAKSGKEAAFAGVFQHPPTDTREIMQPEAYLADEKQPRFEVAPLEHVLGKGWRKEDVSGIGELDLRVILEQWKGKAAAKSLAPSWRGGYMVTFARRNAAPDAPIALAMVVNFSSPKAAERFAKIYAGALSVRYRQVRAGDARREWTTDEGPVRLYVDDARVVALESFPQEAMAKLHAALLPVAAMAAGR